MPQGVEISHKVCAVSIGQEVALLGFRSLAGILEARKPFLAGFRHVAADHVGRMPIMPCAGPNQRVGGFVGQVVAQHVSNIGRQGLIGFLSVLGVGRLQANEWPRPMQVEARRAQACKFRHAQAASRRGQVQRVPIFAREIPKASGALPSGVEKPGQLILRKFPPRVPHVRFAVRQFRHAGQRVCSDAPIFPKPAGKALHGGKVVIRRRDALADPLFSIVRFARLPQVGQEADNRGRLQVRYTNETATVQTGFHARLRQFDVLRRVPLGG